MLLDCPISRIVLLTYLASLQHFFTVCSISALAFEVLQSLLLLGIYTSLSIICAYILLQRRHNAHWIFPVLGLALYTLASADIVYTMWLLFGKLLKGDLLISYTYIRPHHWLFITNRYVCHHLAGGIL